MNPANVSVALPSELPVLPAIGRRPNSPPTGPAVPPSHRPEADCCPTGQRAASVAARATSALIARWHAGLAAAAGSPAESTMDITGNGLQYMPSAPSVAYALARSSGVNRRRRG